MALEVIGAGFGRTGTLSFKLGLEQLGFGPCYHMLEVFGRPMRGLRYSGISRGHPDHIKVWATATKGGPVDWDALLAGYRSTCDWPACTFWRELRTANPHAKVVLTRRDPNAWYESMRRTILDNLEQPGDGPGREMTRALIAERTFGGQFDRHHVLEVLAAHEQDVIASLPPDELLVYDVAEGWEPLSAFLGVAVPDEPFPNTNTTSDFRTAFRLDAPT